MSKQKHKKQKKNRNDALQISLKRGEYITYKSSSYTDYMIQGRLFVVIKGCQWIGIYNLDSIEYIAYIDDVNREE